MHNVYNMLYRKIPANKKELNGKHKINGKIKIKTKTLQTFSTGWCYQPVLMVYQHPGLGRATWWHFSAGSCRTGTKGGGL